MAHMPADGSFDSTNSSNTDDDDGVRGAVQGLVKKDVRGVSCIAAWCTGRHSVEHPVVRITVQPKLNKYKWKQELRTLMQYLRRSDDYIDGVISAYEAASKEVLPPIVEGQKRLTRKQCDYRVHPFHFFSVVSGGGHGRPSSLPRTTLWMQLFAVTPCLIYQSQCFTPCCGMMWRRKCRSRTPAPGPACKLTYRPRPRKPFWNTRSASSRESKITYGGIIYTL